MNSSSQDRQIEPHIEAHDSKSTSTINSTPTTSAKDSKNSREITAVRFSRLFRFAVTRDYLMMFFGTIGAAVDGATMPFFALLFGNVADDFGPGNTGDQIVHAAGKIAWEFAVVGVVSFIASYIGFTCWMIVGERQGIEIRKRYFKSLLYQEIAFYDSINPNELSTKIAEECFNIQQGIGDKVPTFVYSLAMMVTGFIIGYIKGWQLALVLTGFMPVMVLTGGLFVRSMQKLTKINNEAYSRAGAVSEEALNAIRTVVSLCGQEKETRRYQKILNENSRPIVKYSIIAGVSIGVFFLTMFGVYALGFFVGSIFIDNGTTNAITGEPYTAGDVTTVFFAILMASFTPARAVPAIKAFAIAKAAGAKAFKVIDRKSLISIADPRGLKPESIEGNISFKDVVFAYPLKPDRIILNEICFDIRKNEKTALVGESGCGKTTCMQLIERFYDIEKGSITLDGNELKDLNLKWMRENIGYVGQEPVLFATSIKENLLMAKDDATDDEVWEALKKANAYDFVSSLPEKLDTFVGSSGAQLSGGQKQRLAIARAILKNPKILLLDESTSALDRKNEREIQKTLDEIATGRTTIVIAHRLTTIQNADHIIVIDQGKVVEEGKHPDLIEKKGKYYALQHLQLQAEEKEAQNQAAAPQFNESNLPEVVVQDIPEDLRQSDLKINAPKETSMGAQIELEQFNVGNETERALKEERKTEAYENKVDKKQKKKKNSLKYKTPIFRRLLTYNREDIHLIVIGIISALIHGCVFPFIAVILANMIDVFSQPDASNFRSRANLLSLYFLICAIVAFISQAIQMSCFNVVAERLSRKVRGQVFQKYVRMPIGWFDLPENSPGALGSKLSSDATLINTLTGSVFGVYVQAASSFIAGMIIAFIATWQLTLVGIALSPLMMISGKIRAKFNQSYTAGSDEAYQGSVAFVSEAVNNMRTVVSFGKEDKLLENYSSKLDQPLKAATKNAHYSGIAFGVGQFLNFAVYALIFYIGALFIRDIGLGFKDMFQSILAIMFAAMGTGNALQFAPDVGAAKAAAISIFKVLDTKPAIDIEDPKQTVRKPIKGDIEFRNVWFKYPSREKQIFSGLSFKINWSHKVALVGPSGCGKSTVLALLQRFYDPDQGEILLDGVNIKEYDLQYMRGCFGVVSQEPVLFNGTIEYNLKYTKENATDEEMKQAAAEANALGFIINNEFDVIGDEGGSTKYGTGFQRLVGPKGSQLSGGQKQRIAIARAILKNPSVLILDEATSALDSQNEKIVQLSLDKIMEGKTSVVVAHRISTIRDADEILVFNEGEIVERGRYGELVQAQGTFYKLERGMGLTS